jgi:hypothetical protein
MSETNKVKMANVTTEEKESAMTRVHDKDKKDFISAVKKIVKAKDIKVKTYIFKELHDGFMLKIEIEKFMGGKSMGTRWLKGYLTPTIKVELEKLLDDIPKKYYVDTRDQVERYNPVKIIKGFKEAPTDIDLATLWDSEEK